MSKILIIDDEVQIRSLLARMLGLEGYEVCQAGDCKAAIRQLEIHKKALLFRLFACGLSGPSAVSQSAAPPFWR